MSVQAVNQQTIYEQVAAIPDPEIPAVSIAELGILRAVTQAPDGSVRVSITPTYSGCPAMNTIEQDIVNALAQSGIEASVELVLHPPWTTDSITEEGRHKLKAYGIAPPAVTRDLPHTENVGLAIPLFVKPEVICPQCESPNTVQVSVFGATACKEQWRCDDCLEPFEYFKCHR